MSVYVIHDCTVCKFGVSWVAGFKGTLSAQFTVFCSVVCARSSRVYNHFQNQNFAGHIVQSVCWESNFGGWDKLYQILLLLLFSTSCIILLLCFPSLMYNIIIYNLT